MSPGWAGSLGSDRAVENLGSLEKEEPHVNTNAMLCLPLCVCVCLFDLPKQRPPLMRRFAWINVRAAVRHLKYPK